MADVVTAPVIESEGTASPAKKAEDAKAEAAEVVEAHNLLAQGKRNLFCGEYPQAVSQLAEASTKFAKKYGDTGSECSEVLYHYGVALLELARVENGVLGNALEGMDDDTEEEDKSSEDDKIEKSDITEEEKEDIAVKVYDAMAEREEEKAAKEKADKEKADKEKGDEEKKDEEKKEENGEKKENGENGHTNGETNGVENGKTNGHSNGTTNGETNGHSNGVENGKDDSSQEGGDTEEEGTAEESEDIEEEEGEGEEKTEEGEKMEGTEDAGEGGSGEGSSKKEADDVSNLQLAWEILETAKNIFAKDESKDKQLRLADTHLRLGEVGVESELYPQALKDFQSCLDIQLKHEPEDSRLVAETYYQMGVACNLSGDNIKAIEHLAAANKILQLKKENLTKFVEKSEEAKKKDSFDPAVIDAEKDIRDLDGIIPDILQKIEDCKEEMKEEKKVKEMVKEELAAACGATIGFGSSSTTETEKPKPIAVKKANDISGMIRKKRKPEEEEAEEAKKAKTDEKTAENGDKKTTDEEKKTDDDKKTAEKGEGDAKSEDKPMETEESKPSEEKKS